MIEYDVAVIGGGASGLTSAFTAKGFGKKVVLIEKNKTGGECTWSGCIPSKALINQAHKIHSAKQFADFDVDTEKVMENVRQIINNVYKEETPEVIKEHKIDVIEGFAKIKDKKTIIVNNKEITAKKIIISTGSSPFIPKIDGIDDVDYLTNENFFKQEKLPQSIIVLGGGAIGVELSQAMNRVGVKVTLVEMMDSILFREDEDLVSELTKILKDEGVTILEKTKAVKVEKDGDNIRLTVENEGEKKQITSDKILVAVGRKPNIEGLGLDEIGIKYNRKGIEVDNHLRTTVENIYACGDIAGPYQFSHMANYQGIVATTNAMLPVKRSVDYSNVAWCTFTDPELAHAGLLEKEAKEKYGDEVRVYTYDYNKLDRAKTNPGSKGIVKVIVDKKGFVLGAHILGERAGELISEIQVVKTLNINMSKLQKVIHPYPVYSEALRQIGKNVYIDNILHNPVVEFVRSLRK